MKDFGSVVALAGGVGGARLVDGLDQVLPDGALSVIVNTGDDFQHWGLRISPDLDTVMYTLAGLASEEQGWGIAGDTFNVLGAVKAYGGEAWFQLGDRDLATHFLRTRALTDGERLTTITERLCAQLGVTRLVLPMTDSPRPTFIHTSDGRELELQEWLVRERSRPRIKGVEFRGVPAPTSEVLQTLRRADLVVICPSNPYVSIDPILSLDGLVTLLAARRVVAVSPIVDGKAVKGPLGQMIEDIDKEQPSARAIANHYDALLHGYVVERDDAEDIAVPVLQTSIIMRSKRDRGRLAQEVLDFARTL